MQNECIIADASYVSGALANSRWRAGRASGQDVSMRTKGDHALAWRVDGKLVRHEPATPPEANRAAALTNRCSRWRLQGFQVSAWRVHHEVNIFSPG